MKYAAGQHNWLTKTKTWILHIKYDLKKSSNGSIFPLGKNDLLTNVIVPNKFISLCNYCIYKNLRDSFYKGLLDSFILSISH
jgi:hypothetical protein